MGEQRNAVRSGRISLKARLTVIYGGLFTVTGVILLTINYLLVRATFPPAFDTTEPIVTITRDGTVAGTGPSTASTAPLVTGTIGNQLAEYRSSVLRNLVLQSVVAIVLTGLVALLLGWFVANRALRPVHAITATARRLGADSLDTRRLAVTGPRDEVTELADTFDEMLDRLASSFDSQRRFVANASHELRTPLAVQRTLVEVALADPGADQRLRQLGGRLLTMNERSERLIDGLLVLARSERGLPAVQPVRLDRIVGHAVAAVMAEARAAGVAVTLDAVPRLVAGDHGLLERLASNLVQNAVRHNVPDGLVWVTVAETGPAIVVRNSGPGVDQDTIPGLLEPFRRGGTQRTGSDRGVGLGLSIVASVVTAHNGSLAVTPDPTGGLHITVHLPPANPSVPGHPERAADHART